MKDPLKYFRVEARDILEQLQSGLLELERNPEATELVKKLLRLAHTLKGAARVVKQTSIADLAHQLEDLLLPLKSNPGPLPAERANELLAVVDAVARGVATLEPAPEPQPAAGPASANPSPSEPAPAPRATEARPPAGSRAQLEPLVGSVNELGYQLGGIRQAAPELSRAQQLAEELSRRLEPQRTRDWGAAGRRCAPTARSSRRGWASSSGR
jgi:two-component system chemotaxis sensor kinase CheA